MDRAQARLSGIRVSFASRVDPQALEASLRRRLHGEVRFEPESRALYATDASNYRQVPIGVVIPQDEQDVEAAVATCREFGVPIVPRGCGTSLAGQTCNVAVVIDFSKTMHHLLELDAERREARVQPGIILDHLRAAAERHNLTFGPDPATHNRCTLGGMIGNDSCGVHAQMAGRTSQNILELDVLTYDGHRMRVKSHYEEDEIQRVIQQGGRKGEIFAKLRALRDRYADRIRERFPRIPRLVSGYGLQFLLPENGFNVAAALVGTEGTCVVVMEALTRLVYSPPGRTLVMLGYPDVYHAADHIPDVLLFDPVALEGLDDKLIDFMELKGMHTRDLSLLPEGKGWLLVELGGKDREESDRRAEEMMAALRRRPDPPSMRRYGDPADEARIWTVRESGLAATAIVPGHRDSWPGWEDSAVPPDQAGAYLRELRALFDRYGYEASLYGHFGQGCIHCSIDFELRTEKGRQDFRSFVEEAAHLVVKHGGSLSGEHGDGQARAELLPIMFGDELVGAFREFKGIWDPQGMMNPGKVVDPYPITSNLRLGADYRPPTPVTHFKFPEDHGSFAHATQRCVGVGVCRRTEGGLMCPSFMVTREEEHTTRGRAHSLFEMMHGGVLKHGWHDPGVKKSLELCLSCKGCKADCPVNVDMATYKAEFLSHFYEGTLRPMPAYAMGLIHRWVRVAETMPRVANFVTQTAPLSTWAKALAGLAPSRQLPPFALQTFKQWFKQRGERNPGGPRVVLWADTFSNHFHPEIAIAALEVLEHAGFHVLVPEPPLCCGRPLYDYGFLHQAEALLRQVLKTLKPYVDEGLQVVGVEPSCIAVFRDELTNLMPNDPVAHQLKAHAWMLSEFLERYAKDVEWPRLERKAVVHGHCHHKAIMKLDDEKAVLERLGVDYRMPEDGCCGMAGSFGFEADKVEVAQRIGERALLPAIRRTPEDELIIADGFSCQEQIIQGTGRRPLHLAEVLKMALHQGQPSKPRVEPRRPAIGEFALLAGGLALGAMLAVRAMRSRR